MSPAASEVVEIVTVPLLVFPLMHVPEVEVRTHALPLAVAMVAESRLVVEEPPFGVYLPSWIAPVPVTVGAAGVPVMTPVPPMTSTSTMVAANGMTQCPEN